jgi:hypothetical protein
LSEKTGAHLLDILIYSWRYSSVNQISQLRGRPLFFTQNKYIECSVKKEIIDLVSKQNYIVASNLIVAFELKSQFPIRTYLQVLVDTNNVDEAIILAGKDLPDVKVTSTFGTNVNND